MGVPFRIAAVDIEPFWRGEITFGAVPAVDILEKDDAYKVMAEERTDIEIASSEGTLTIKGQRVEPSEDEELHHFLAERRYGPFQRTFRLPNGVDAESIVANFKDGVLTVMLPKTSQARRTRKRIAVERG